MASDLLTVAQGLSARWTLTIRDTDGAPFTAYTGSEVLAGSVHAGRNQAPLFFVSPTWLSAPAGTVSLPIPGSATANIEPGQYTINVRLADGSADLYDGYIKVTYSAGTALALPSYSSYADLLDRAPWCEKLQRLTDLAGFARQRYLARLWFDDLIHRHYGGYWPGRQSVALRGWLADDRLLVTGPIVDACSNYAIALLCDRQVTPTAEDSGYARAARKHYAMSEDAATNIVAEIDSDGDGTADLAVNLGLSATVHPWSDECMHMSLFPLSY